MAPLQLGLASTAQLGEPVATRAGVALGAGGARARERGGDLPLRLRVAVRAVGLGGELEGRRVLALEPRDRVVAPQLADRLVARLDRPLQRAARVTPTVDPRLPMKSSATSWLWITNASSSDGRSMSSIASSLKSYTMCSRMSLSATKPSARKTTITGICCLM